MNWESGAVFPLRWCFRVVDGAFANVLMGFDPLIGANPCVALSPRQTKQELDAFFTILRDFEVMEGETAEEMAEDVTFTPVQSGGTRWRRGAGPSSGGGTSPGAAGAVTLAPETTFSVSLDLSHYRVGDVIAIYSLARTDQGWAFNGDSGDIGDRPSTNIVNARTNPAWSHVHSNSMDGGSLIKGRLDWFSVPVTIEIGEFGLYLLSIVFILYVLFLVYALDCLSHFTQ